MSDISSIVTAAEAHIASYLEALLSQTKITTIDRAAKMASHYLSQLAIFTDGHISMISDPSQIPGMIVPVLDTINSDEGLLIKYQSHEVKPIGTDSAAVWVTLNRKGKVWTNVYFFRKLEDGSSGWEGGNFDGETRVLRELAAEASDP